MNSICKILTFGLLCSAAEGPADLAGFAGKTPFEKVEGYRLLEVPHVRDVLGRHGAELSLLDAMDAGTDIALRGDTLLVGLCDRDACAETNAALALALDGGLVALCTFEAPGPSAWKGPLLKKKSAAGPCPQEPDAFMNVYAGMRE
ncbi:MAG: hypothetical protein ACKVP5_05255 [Aestuariivirga sp.]